MANIKDFLRIILDALGLSLNSVLATFGWVNLTLGFKTGELKSNWDWAFFIGDLVRVTIMSLLSIGFLAFRIYVEYRRFKKEHETKSENNGN